MRRWKVVTTLSATLVVAMALLGFMSASCGPARTRPPTVGALGSNGGPGTVLDTLRLMVGESIDLALRPSNPPAVVIRRMAPEPVAATFAAAPSLAIEVSATGRVTARRAGEILVTATSQSPPNRQARVFVQALTAEDAANEVAMEICPNEEDRVVPRIRPLTASVPPIHEFHDCQRLIENGAYSAVVGIFASEGAQRWKSWDDYRDGKMAATIVNFAAKRPTRYAALDIAPGTSCLILKADSPTVWKAAILPQRDSVVTAGGGRNYAQCADTLNWSHVLAWPRDSLHVIRQTGVDMKRRRKSPPVARWDWDWVRGENYIGVSCDSVTWCEIGRRGFTPSDPYTRVVPDSHGAVDTILKGYYDEQLLANESGRAPSSVFGRIVPGKHIGDAADMKYDSPDWQHVAQITLRETAATPSPDYLRYVRQLGTWPPSNEGVAIGATLPAGGNGKPPLVTESAYRLKSVRESSSSKYGLYRGRFNAHDLPADSIVYRHHSHLRNMPPTVRWRWVETDERTWTYCDPEGCCENLANLK